MLETTTEKLELLKKRRRLFGFSYGAAAGLAFAIALWGYDGALLSQSHGLFPWLKFLVGGLLTTLTGGLAGWLTSRIEKILPGILFWMIASALYALYTNIVPLVLAPRITGLLVPEISTRLLYTPFENLPTLIGVAFAWNIIASIICGIIQLPMLEPALYSLSGFGKVKPHLLCAFLMLVSGGVADTLVNKPLRDPILSLDSTIQFIVDMRGQTVDKETSREKHLASFRVIDPIIQDSRQMVVSRYDRLLENIYVMMNFGGQWAECPTFFGTPLTCQLISP